MRASNKSTVETKSAKPPLEVVGTERGTRACGHEDDFKILKGEKPEYAARRKEKWLAKRCAACVAEIEKRQQEEAVKRRQLQPKDEAKFRLPHGSAFAVTYDKVTESWSGTLTVPRATDDVVIGGTHRGVHGLLRKLGNKWNTEEKKS